ncbi:diguanylate cyclase domain-containing protein [Undibacterium sp.]|uniref:diguanylate cyclase domain-containing protein n=1 Tax=Undibacterium sp. TaxID=1914977 RepID=UPI00374CD1F2
MPDNEPGLATILIVDDNPDIIRLLSSLLVDKAEILFATSGQAAISIAKKRRPDLILLDVQMPEMDGFAVCRALKADSDTRDGSVIFVTAGDDDASELMALEAGAVDFIAKPLRPAIVRARVETHLTLQRQSREMKKLVHRDGLTGIFNRRYFDEQLATEVQRHRRQNLPLGLMLVDVDHFKIYNDTMGHLQGDACLQKIAATLSAAARRPAEVVARYGGEEFAIILPGSDEQDTEKFGAWVLQNIRELALPHPHSPTSGTVSISVGLVSCFPDPHLTPELMIARADQALYKAKSQGRNRFHAYQMPEPKVDRLHIAALTGS